ncbi:MAG TPA: hypothetical protein VFE46_19715 [Pirellulales bacterium]|nr:hypothetical protein [Pirellulales bacterium]
MGAGTNWPRSHEQIEAALEWGARGGALLTVGITFAGLILAGYRRQSSKTFSQPLPPAQEAVPSLGVPRSGVSQRSRRWSGAVYYARNSALWPALLLLLASIGLSSQWISDVNSNYQRELARLDTPAWLSQLADEHAKELKLNLPDGQTSWVRAQPP